MSFPTPFDRYRGEVLPAWIDANGHMNLAYYIVLFDCATDALFDAIGIGLSYKDATNHGTFVVETHNLYERELLVGEQVRVATQILGTDSKRLHLAHEMFSLASGERAATQELMYVHIDLAAPPRRRVAAGGSRERRCRGGGAFPPPATRLGRAPDRDAGIADRLSQDADSCFVTNIVKEVR